MKIKPFTWLGKLFRGIWKVLDFSRILILNLIVLVFLIALFGSIFSGNKKVDEKTTLVIDIRGELVEQHEGASTNVLLSEAMGQEKRNSTQLRDVLLALDHAKNDPAIHNVLLLLDDMQNAGFPMLREIASQVKQVKAAGKKVVAWGNSYSQKQYYLAAHANEVYLHPMGMVMLTGFGGYQNYYKDALDKLGVSVSVIKAGSFKSFGESYVANGPSREAAEASKYLYDDLWKQFTTDIEKARQLSFGAVNKHIDELPELLKTTNGNAAQLTVDLKYVDGLKTRDELRAMFLQTGVRDPNTKSFRQVNLSDYVALQRPKLVGPAVGVIVAAGTIVDGNAPAGQVGGNSTSQLIRKAREDDSIKAVVLRVDSPGGSAFASELIRRELELTQQAGKPVVISMGSVAASGGYWISMSSDEVIAEPATITGSIGVIAMLPNFEKTMEKVGVHTAGTTTTWLADGLNPLRPMDPRMADLIQQGINHTYSQFTGKAAAARKSTQEKIDKVAQGRVWTGQQAFDRGLVDKLGSFSDAIHSAAKRAKLDQDYRITYLEREPSLVERAFNLFDAKVSASISKQTELAMLSTGIPRFVGDRFVQDMSILSQAAKSNYQNAVLTHCMCQQP